MASTPKYVRLAERLNRSIVADVESGSGWSIAGLDVKEVPDPKVDPLAYQFVVDSLRVGRLEKADKAEYDEVKAVSKKVAEAGAYDPETETHNEAAIQDAVKAASRRLVSGIGAADEDDEDEESEDEDDFSTFTRDELVEYGNSAHNLGLAGNISKEEALAAVEAAEADAS